MTLLAARGVSARTPPTVGWCAGVCCGSSMRGLCPPFCLMPAWPSRRSSGTGAVCTVRIADRSGSTAIVVVQDAAQHLVTLDGPVARILGQRHRTGPDQALMRAPSVVERDLRGEHPVEMELVQGARPVQTLPAGRPDRALRDPVRLGEGRRGAHDLEPLAAEGGVESGRELAAPIVQEDGGRISNSLARSERKRRVARSTSQEHKAANT